MKASISIFSSAAFLLGAVYVCLLIAYAPTMLRQVAGENTVAAAFDSSRTPTESPYMDDVGEAQVALNVWGTLHHSGYPLWTISGNLFVSALRAAGVSPEFAPTLHSTFWHFVGLGIFYALLHHLTGSSIVSAMCTLLLGLTHTIWFHAVVPEVYSLSLTFQLGLIGLALWRGLPIYRRIMFLALLGGLGVAHHRLIALLMPALLYAVLPEALAALRSQPRRALLTGAAALATGLAGFLPYIYLPLRAQAGAVWVYGDPSTWEGFWHEFTGAEAAFLFAPPADLSGILDNISHTIAILFYELLPLLFVSSILALIAVPFLKGCGRLGGVLWLAFGAYFAWLAVLHHVVMPQAAATVLVAVLLLALGIVWARLGPETRWVAGSLFTAMNVLFLISVGAPFVAGLTSDPVGVQVIAAARGIPRDQGAPILMLPWGPRHTAVAFSVYVTGENADLRLVKHTADLGALSREGTLYTLRDTFYRFPLEWWRERLGAVHLSSPALDVVRVSTAPQRADSAQVQAIGEDIGLLSVSCTLKEIGYVLDVEWIALRAPEHDLSVFVHLLPSEGDVPLAQGDVFAPVYGWYPTRLWSAGEVVRDHYWVPNVPGGTRIAFGLYRQDFRYPEQIEPECR